MTTNNSSNLGLNPDGSTYIGREEKNRNRLEWVGDYAVYMTSSGYEISISKRSIISYWNESIFWYGDLIRCIRDN